MNVCVVSNNVVSDGCDVFLVFMWRSIFKKTNFSSEVFINLTFYNVLARQGSLFCNRARMSFHTFALRDIRKAVA